MKFQRSLALLSAGALLAGLFAGCGTSHMPSEESFRDDRDDWQVEISSVTTARIAPSPQPDREVTRTTDVTGQYMDQFVGLWDNEDKTEVWEFKSNENLTVTDQEDGEKDAYTYWFEDDGIQPLLFLFENGHQEAERYSFTFSGNNLTLYEADTGEAEESLTRRQEEARETATAQPSPSAAPSPSPTEAPTSVPTVSPSAAPSPSPAAEPSPSPEPETEIQLPADLILPVRIEEALPAVECAMDAELDGTAFDPQDSASFWAIMARYLSRLSDSDDSGYFTVTETQVRDAAKTIFSAYDPDAALPECSGPAEASDGGYRVRWGVTGGHDLEVVSFDGESKMELQADGNKIYLVTLDGDGALISIEQTA